MDWLEKYNIQVDDWPPKSPDLNTIEHYRIGYKRTLHREYPDTLNTHEGLDNLIAMLAEVRSKTLVGDTWAILCNTVKEHAKSGGGWNRC